ncbi:MAG TPA: hypothetical protein VGD91_02415 [Trebonia sp.]
MSGQWPPEWEDTGDVLPAGADQPDAEASPRLAEVSAYLASVPAPALPDSIGARISAALAAEAATRTAGRNHGELSPAGGTTEANGAASPGTPSESLTPESPALAPRPAGRAPARARVRRRLRLPKASTGLGLLVACLLFAGFGWVVSRGSSQSSSSAAAGAAAAPAASSSSAAGSSGSGAESAPKASGSAGSSAIRPGVAPLAPVNPGAAPLFTVIESGTAYQHAALARQARAREASVAGAARFTPTSQLIGCVLHFTGGTLPRLVDRASYQGTDAYVIASSSRVWVVGLGCTAAKPELVVSVPLAG